MCKSNLVLKPTDLPYAHLFRAVNIPLDDKSMRAAALVGLNSKNPPKIKIQKFREIDWLYLCLQQFDKFLYMKCNAMTGNGRYDNLSKTCQHEIIREITRSCELIFSGF